jgi:energy-coupling factor transporter ATP-binding protein EcfA2
MIELGVGFHPELTGRENVFLNASIHGLSREEVEEIYSRVVDYSGLAHFMDVPIKNYSSGMHMRVGFAIAANLNPDVLLLDEIFAVGDADFQQRCVATVKQFVEEGKTVLFVSHSPDSIRTICRRAIVLDHGELTYDGDVDGALDFYERHATHQPEAALAASAAAPGDAIDPTEEVLERSAHRTAFGGHWRETGAWQFEFLRRQQLQPDHYVLEVGCGSLATAAHLLPFLTPGHYLGVERNIALLNAGRGVELPRLGVSPERGHYLISATFDLPEAVGLFDVALASSLFPYMPFNTVARCIVSVVRKLRLGGRFYATWFENPDVADLEPITHANDVTTYPDREPFHYSLSLIAAVCEAAGASVERLSDDSHPRGESVIVITRLGGPATVASPLSP